MIPKEEFEKAVEFCTNADENCAHCPLSKKILHAADILPAT